MVLYPQDHDLFCMFYGQINEVVRPSEVFQYSGDQFDCNFAETLPFNMKT